MFLAIGWLLVDMDDKSVSIIDNNNVKEHETLLAGKTPFKVILISAILASVILVFDLAFPLSVTAGVHDVALMLAGTWYFNICGII